MAESATQSVGRRTEQLAQEHLESLGLTTIVRNYRCRHGEIDRIMLDGETLVFVEVRYRRPGSFAGAVASVDANKQRKLTRTAAFFLGKHPVYRDNPVRFDVVGLEGPEDQEIKLQWLRDAFRPEEN